MLQATLESLERILGPAHWHPSTVQIASNLDHDVQSEMHPKPPIKRGGKAAALRKERVAAAPLSPTALAEAEARPGALAAEEELLAMLELPVEEGIAGSGKGKAQW